MAVTLKSRIPLIIGELDDRLLEAVTELGERIADGAKDRVPVETGALRDAIHVVVKDDQEVAVVAGDNVAFYGHMVENGTVKAPPHPFLVPAFEAELPDLAEIVGERLEDL